MDWTMRETPLITFTKADDSGCGTRDVGDLDFIIHSSNLIRWLSNGNNIDETVRIRANRLASELRKMAEALEKDLSPVSATIESARERRCAIIFKGQESV